MDVLGSDLTDLDNLIRLDNGDLGVLGHGFVEVVHSHAESAVTKLVSLVDLDESVITEDRLFQNVLLAVEFPGFLWFRHFCDGTILVVAYGELTSLHYVRMSANQVGLLDEWANASDGSPIVPYPAGV